MVKYKRVKSLFSEIEEIPEVLDQKTYPSLNGIRGVSILMVVLKVDSLAIVSFRSAYIATQYDRKG
ncbi:hypothetical protein [Mucilaginibacter sp. HD30]